MPPYVGQPENARTGGDDNMRALSERTCVRCIMDTTDPDILFDAAGVCNHCRDFDANIQPNWHPDAKGAGLLETQIRKIQADGRNQRYDCILGISGGVDSSYLATRMVDWGLRPLLVHVDTGWNSELAVRNIEIITSHLGLALHTVVIDWEEMRDLQIAFLNSQVPNQDIPQDHAFAASLFRAAKIHRIKYIISGSNFATESVLPVAWGHDAMDSTQIRDIHRKFGTRKLLKYPLLSFRDYQVRMHGKVKIVSPLNYIEYNRSDAITKLKTTIGWKYYGGKHYESIWTKWFQAHFLPIKYGYDKRKAHLSSLIVAGSLDRSSALKQLNEPLYRDEDLTSDSKFIAKKLGLSTSELQAFVRAPGTPHSTYDTHSRKLEDFKRRQAAVDLVKYYARAAMAPSRVINWLRGQLS